MIKYKRRFSEKHLFNKFETEILFEFNKALELLNNSKNFIIFENNLNESTIRNEKGFQQTLKQAYLLLNKISEKIYNLKKSNIEDFSLKFCTEIIYRCTGHKFTNLIYTHNIKFNLKSLIIDLDNMIKDTLQDILLGSIKSEYFKICSYINDFIIEYNKKFQYKNYKKLLISYEDIMFFHKK